MISIFFSSYQEGKNIVFIIKPYKQFFKYDGLRPENLSYDDTVKMHEVMKATMQSFNVKFFEITMESIQERADFTKREIFKRWQESKRGVK